MTGQQKGMVAAAIGVALLVGGLVGWSLKSTPPPEPTQTAAPAAPRSPTPATVGAPSEVRPALDSKKPPIPAEKPTPPSQPPSAAQPGVIAADPVAPGASPGAVPSRAFGDDTDAGLAPVIADNAPDAADGPAPSPSRETIQQGIATMKPAVKTCYEELLKEFPEADGRVLLQFAIVGDGDEGRIDLEEISGEKSTLLDQRMHDCVLDGLREVSFPAPTTGQVRVSYPFDFSRQ